MSKEIAKAIMHCFESPNIADRNFEPANIVDAISEVGKALWVIADTLKKEKENESKEQNMD